MSKHIEVEVSFTAPERSVHVLPGTLLLEACARAGIILQTPCGGQATCGKCRVRVVEGTTEIPQAGPCLEAGEIAAGWRLACATRVTGPVRLQIPNSSRFSFAHRILTDHQSAATDIEPTITVDRVSLPPPERSNDLPDYERLELALQRKISLSPQLLSQLPARLRGLQWQLQVVREDDTLIDLRPPEPPVRPLGLAVDLGSTTVVATLIDLDTGDELGLASGLNRQSRHGDDVLSRISCVREDFSMLESLRQATLETINHLIDQVCQNNGFRDHIYRIFVAGNSTMQQILCGIDPRPLGEVPFVPAFSRSLTMPAGQIGLALCPEAPVSLFPQPGGFVGGDTVAGILAADLDRLDKPALLIDIGTNGEIVLAHDGHFLCASTAAGPAFEGARIKQGMRAEAGAIEKVIINNGDLDYNVIGDIRPAGICGSALIDAVAQLLRLGLVDETGRIPDHDELAGGVSDSLRQRIEGEGLSRRIRLTAADEPANAVFLYQKDIRELQLANAAIRAGIETLLLRVGLPAEQLDSLLLAGAFGNFIRRDNAQRIGLLPPLPHERILFIGNASSMGAKCALLARTNHRRCETILERCQHVDLGADSDFQTAFSQAMLFPGEQPL